MSGACQVVVLNSIKSKYAQIIITYDILTSFISLTFFFSKIIFYQEYEAERNAVVTVLQSHGIDTSGLQTDASVLEDESVLYQDLSDVVSALAEKLAANKGSEKTAEKMKSLQESLAHVRKEYDELKAIKSATEKRLEASKAAARGSRAEAATVSAEVDFLREQLEQRNGELSTAQGKLLGSADAVSSEVQVLEEENIELMKENAELRKETSTYRLEVEKVKSQLIRQAGVYTDGSTKPKLPVPPSARTPQPLERQENKTTAPCVVCDENTGVCEKVLSMTKASPALVESDIKTRRSRKAKPLVEATNIDAQGGDGEGGECAQS